MPPEPPSAEITRAVAAESGTLARDPRLKGALRDIRRLDRRFDETGGIFFHAGSDALATAQAFTDIHINHYRASGRPSLPALAVHHADKMGIDKSSAAYKALLLVAVRAEMRAAVTPAYHNKFHYMDVAAMTANLLEKNDELSRRRVPCR